MRQQEVELYGEALARAFAGEGARVALVARSADVIEAMAIELEGTSGEGVSLFVSQRLDRIELGRASGWKIAEDHSDGHRK